MIKLKTKEDIATLREGGRRHAVILRKLAEMVKPGISTKELDAEAYRLITEGGDKPAFLNYKPYGAKKPYPASLCTSVNDEVVHGIPSEQCVLQEGDIISIDLGLIHNGLITDMAVTVGVGKISPEAEKLLRVTREALMAGIKAARGGAKTGDIGAAIERLAFSHGYGVIEELSGHGVGYAVHEDPYVPNYGDEGTGSALSPGLVIAIEPMFNIGDRHVVLSDDGYTYLTEDGSLSAHFEHTIVITKSGAEILTQE